MKKIMILAVPLLLGAGGGGYFLLNGGDEPSASHEAAADPRDPHAQGDSNYYVEIDPITATIFRGGEAAGVFTAAVTLQIADEDARTEIVQGRRRLRDAMFRELHAMFEREEYTGRKVDVEAVKQRMLVVSRRELGDDVVIDVFVNTLMRRGA